jgi:hypothetical protein
MDIDLIDGLTNWQEYLALTTVAWSEGAARAKTAHVKLPFNLGSVLAITLFPFVFYSKRAWGDECVRIHEETHIKQVRKLGAITFYTKYLILAIKHGGGRKHPMEQEGYLAQYICEQKTKNKN